MKQYKLVIFDWDGTLMDSSARIVACIQNAATDLELPMPTRQQSRDVIGLNLHDCLSRLFGTLPEEQVNAYIDRYRYHFYHPQAHSMPMFEGVIKGLEALDRNGFFLAVATG